MTMQTSERDESGGIVRHCRHYGTTGGVALFRQLQDLGSIEYGISIIFV